MTYEVYRYIFMGSAMLAVLTLAISVFLFILFKIPKVIGDVTGRTIKKAVKEIREQNMNSGDKAYKPSPINMARGKLTDKITPSGKLIQKADLPGTIFQTAEIGEQDTITADETEVLIEDDESGAGTTTLLSVSDLPEINMFEVEYDITFVHTNEIII